MAELPTIKKLFDYSPKNKSETITPLLQNSSFKLEHIASNSQASEIDFWYDQDNAEWVALIQGKATLQFEKNSLHLTAGDALTIPPHTKHKVSRTSKNAIWLALHYESTGP